MNAKAFMSRYNIEKQRGRLEVFEKYIALKMGDIY